MNESTDGAVEGDPVDMTFLGKAGARPAMSSGIGDVQHATPLRP
jgi:hypothetical protein